MKSLFLSNKLRDSPARNCKISYQTVNIKCGRFLLGDNEHKIELHFNSKRSIISPFRIQFMYNSSIKLNCCSQRVFPAVSNFTAVNFETCYNNNKLCFLSRRLRRLT